MTFGLRSHFNFALEGFRRDKDSKDCKNLLPIHESLIKERIHKQLHYRPCGLVVDPRWNQHTLLFPWAIYEAKKAAETFERAESQLYTVGSVCLGMLDDLCRDPENPQKYQEGAPKDHIIFGITSSANLVIIYRIMTFLGDCVSKPSRALPAIADIVS
jgi:hypothetical protein